MTYSLAIPSTSKVLENGKPPHLHLMRGDCLAGRLTWFNWPGQSGYRYLPNTTARKSTRKLRSTIRDTLISGARLSAKDADQALESLKHLKTEGKVA